jgi:hypothetical protein
MSLNLAGVLRSTLKELERHLQEKVGHLSENDAQDIVSLLPDLHVPGLITLLCLGARTSTPEARTIPFPLTEQHISTAIAAFPATKAGDARRAAQLLMSGQFTGDIAEAVAVILHTIPDVPLEIVRDVRSLPHFPRRFTLAIERDLGENPSAIRAVVRDLRQDGTIHSQPKILTNTLRVIFRQAAPKKIGSTIHTLLGNDSVRLAIIIYARSKGVEISEHDLDQVRTAINPDDPDLGALLEPGYQHLVEQFGKEQAMELLGQFVS